MNKSADASARWLGAGAYTAKLSDLIHRWVTHRLPQLHG